MQIIVDELRSRLNLEKASLDKNSKNIEISVAAK
jgi:hypothetical protein